MIMLYDEPPEQRSLQGLVEELEDISKVLDSRTDCYTQIMLAPRSRLKVADLNLNANTPPPTLEYRMVSVREVLQPRATEAAKRVKQFVAMVKGCMSYLSEARRLAYQSGLSERHKAFCEAIDLLVPVMQALERDEEKFV